MKTNLIEMQGTLQPNGTLILDEKPALPLGRVRVALQAISAEAESGADVLAVLLGIRAEQKARGQVPRTKEEIDTAVTATRNEDEERLLAIERLHEECQRSGSVASSPGK